ncbi:hypothetical protein BC834DRAFT_52771 [Gloeopeniophorella convolvens]|nr:hypothetical protein BC834DRAFT_52771 [Gloeopeniophorella convolvens]
MATKELRPIPPNPPRWQPNGDPASIVVAGLDTTASIHDQIDQIDQLITLRLQDIDADFSKMQQVLSNRILPAFKRYSIGTEPVREAAKFWTSFYEQAAQVRIPIYEDLSSVQEPSADAPMDENRNTLDTEQSPSTLDPSLDATFDPNRTPSESSFLPAHAAVSSTPAAAAGRTWGTNNTSFTPQPPAGDPSWNASLESPLVRLDRELREFAQSEPRPASFSSVSIGAFSAVDLSKRTDVTATDDETVHPQARAPAPAPATLQKPRPTARTQTAAPPAPRPKAVTPARNPYLPPRADPLEWSGVIDLRAPPPQTPPAAEDEDEFTLTAGMSPPVTLAFATLPTLARSPAKRAAEDIRRALVRDALRSANGESNTMTSASGSAVPTPPSLARYTRGAGPGGDTSHGSTSLAADPELDSMMRRVGLGRDPQHWYSTSSVSSAASVADTPSVGGQSTPSYYATPAPAPAATYAHDPAPAPETPLPSRPHLFADVTPESDDLSMSSTSSSEDSVHNTAHPSAAFLLASRQRGRHDHDDEDDDFDDEDDSLDADPDAAAALAPVHPFARAAASGVGADDSFDSLDGDEGGSGPEETVFGAPPAERGARDAQLRMLGADLLQDTIGIGTQLARAGRIEESPTPWGGGGRDG